MNALMSYLEQMVWVKALLEDYAVVPYAALIAAALVALEAFRRAPLSENTRMAILLAISVITIAWLDRRSAYLMTLLTCIVYLIEKSKIDYKKYVPLLTALSVFGLISTKAMLANWTPSPLIVLGLSYYVLRLISVVIEVGRKNPDYAEIKALPFFTYIFFLPIFFAGPVQRYADFRRVDVDEKFAPWLYTRMALLIVLKMAVVDFLLLQAIIMPIRTNLVPVVLSWTVPARLGLFVGHGFISIVYHYLDFVLYTELAKTFGRLLGYHVIDNFNYPLLATSIADFWRRWHMSLSNWARDYVFMPVMVRSRRIWLGSYVTMLMIGLWHSFNLNWFIWAIAHGTALVSYDRLRRSSFYRNMNSSPRSARVLSITGWLLTLCFIGSVNNLIAFPLDYSLAWKFARQALLGLP